MRNRDLRPTRSGALRGDPRDWYSVADLDQMILNETLAPGAPFLVRFADTVMTDIKQATELVEDTTKVFHAACDKMRAKTEAIAEQSKKTSGAVRDAQQKLADGIDRLNKTADFARLERQVELLERAAAAMQTLAELDKSGHLEKFARAIK